MGKSNCLLISFQNIYFFQIVSRIIQRVAILNLLFVSYISKEIPKDFMPLIISLSCFIRLFSYPSVLMLWCGQILCISSIIIIIIIINNIIIKRGQQWKAEREWYTQYQCENPSPTISTYRQKEIKENIARFLYNWQKIVTNKNISSKGDDVLFIIFFSKIYNKQNLFSIGQSLYSKWPKC